MYDQYMGVIKALGFSFVPDQWGYCGGALIAVSQFAALFSLLGCRFGGDCQTTFALPDLRGRVAMGQGAGPGLTTRQMGQEPGYYQEYLDTGYMPAHKHSFTYAGGGGGAELALHVSSDSGKVQTATDGDLIAVAASGLGAPLGNGFIDALDVTATASIGGVTAQINGFNSNALTIANTPQPTSAVNLMQPVQAVNYCICMDGMYPSRS